MCTHFLVKMKIKFSLFEKGIKFEKNLPPKIWRQSSYILRRPQNFAKYAPYFCLQYIQTKVRWRFAKFCGLLRTYELYWVTSNIRWKIFSNFVPFSKSPNFINTKAKWSLFFKFFVAFSEYLNFNTNTFKLTKFRGGGEALLPLAPPVPPPPCYDSCKNGCGLSIGRDF